MSDASGIAKAAAGLMPDVAEAAAGLMPDVMERLEELVRIPSVAFPGFDPEPVHRKGAAVVEAGSWQAAMVVQDVFRET